MLGAWILALILTMVVAILMWLIAGDCGKNMAREAIAFAAGAMIALLIVAAGGWMDAANALAEIVSP